MTLSYAGVNLGLATAELAAWVERSISPADVYEFAYPPWFSGATNGLSREYTHWGLTPQRPIKVGCLWWPTGASRWAVGHYLCDETQLAAIRAEVYTPGGSQIRTRPLVWADGTRTLSADMWMLPPRPLAQIPPGPGVVGKPLWLLTLADDRYYWWFKAGVVTIVEGSFDGATTWENLYAQIATLLGVTITVDAIPAAYLKPDKAFGVAHEPLPLLLESVSRTVGQRIVRSRDGTIRAMNVTSGRDIQNAQLARPDIKKHAGGQFALTAP